MTAYAPALTAILDREPALPAGVLGDEVPYVVGDLDCLGYVARPADSLPHPGVLVIHDWLGVTDVTRMRCDMLARLGYIAFAADLYGAALRPGPQEAAGVAGGFYGDVPLWRERILGGYAQLRAFEDVEQDRTAAIGFCFGGASALHLARTGAAVKGVVSFHGSLPSSPAGEAERIGAELLVLHGGADPLVPDDMVLAFENELRQTDVDWRIVTYAGAMHAFRVPFANSPEHGAQYDERADRRSWAEMKAFFDELFGR